MGSGIFLTSAAICTTSFLLGILFTSLLWDSTVLFGSAGVSEETLALVEAYYLTWWNGAVAVKSFLHIVLLADFVAVTGKVAKFTDDTFFFSGGSLLLLVFVSALYITITLPYIRAIARDPLTLSLKDVANGTPDLFTKVQEFFSRGNSGPLGDHARKMAQKVIEAPLMSLQDRMTHMSVLCAANTLVIFLLVGVLFLQIGEWWVQVSIVAPIEIEEKRIRKEAEAVIAAAGAERKTQ